MKAVPSPGVLVPPGVVSVTSAGAAGAVGAVTMIWVAELPVMTAGLVSNCTEVAADRLVPVRVRVTVFPRELGPRPGVRELSAGIAPHRGVTQRGAVTSVSITPGHWGTPDMPERISQPIEAAVESSRSSPGGTPK